MVRESKNNKSPKHIHVLGMDDKWHITNEISLSYIIYNELQCKALDLHTIRSLCSWSIVGGARWDVYTNLLRVLGNGVQGISSFTCRFGSCVLLQILQLCCNQ